MLLVINMEYKVFSFRNALEIFKVNEAYSPYWDELEEVLQDISEYDIIQTFLSSKRAAKSISEAINILIKQKLCEKGWYSESYIFADKEYTTRGIWRLDFVKKSLAVEVAFNHGGSAAWNLIKPVLSSELNHVEKAIQTRAGVIITATDSLKKAGGFDGAIGTYEKYISYLKPLNTLLTVPLVIIGLEAPKTFKIKHEKVNGSIKGIVEKIEKD